MKQCRVSKWILVYLGQINDSHHSALESLAQVPNQLIFFSLSVLSSCVDFSSCGVFWDIVKGQLFFKVALHVLQLIFELYAQSWIVIVLPSQGTLLNVRSIRIGRYSASSFLTAKKV